MKIGKYHCPEKGHFSSLSDSKRDNWNIKWYWIYMNDLCDTSYNVYPATLDESTDVNDIAPVAILSCDVRANSYILTVEWMWRAVTGMQVLDDLKSALEWQHHKNKF